MPTNDEYIYTVEQRTTTRAKNVRYAVNRTGWTRPMLMSHEQAVQLFTALGDALALPLPPITVPKQCESTTLIGNVLVIQCQGGDDYHGLQHRAVTSNGTQVSWR